MSLRPWNQNSEKSAAKPWSTTLEQINRDMEHFFERVVRGGSNMIGMNTAEGWSPCLDMKQTDQEVVVRLEVPGIPPDNLDLSLTSDTLTLSGHKCCHAAQACAPGHEAKERSSSRSGRGKKHEYAQDHSTQPGTSHGGSPEHAQPINNQAINNQATKRALAQAGGPDAEPAQDDRFDYQESYFGAFTRRITLPCPVNPDKVLAEHSHGVLTVTLTKAEEVRPKRIPLPHESRKS